MTPKLYKCKRCSMQMYTLKKYKCHVSSHRQWPNRLKASTEVGVVQTENFGNSVKTEIKLEEGTDAAEAETPLRLEKIETQDDEKPNLSLEEFTCSKCSTKFYHKGPFIRHFNSCKGFYVARRRNKDIKTEGDSKPNSDRAQRLRRINKPVPASSAAEESFQCPICHQNFFRIGNLLRHLKHSSCSSNPSVSHLNFQQKNFQTSNREVNNNNVVTYGCPHCSKTFGYKSSLKHHMRIHHAQASPAVERFTCRICQKKFQHGFQLEFHYKTHVNQQPHLCRVCGKRFKFRWSLQLHSESHKPESINLRTNIASTRAIKQFFSCHFCGKSFANETEANEHVKVHMLMSTHSCHICGNEYTTRNSLYKHIQVSHLEQSQKVMHDSRALYVDENFEDVSEDDETLNGRVHVDLPLQGHSVTSSIPTTSRNFVTEGETSGSGRLDNDTLCNKVQWFISLLMDSVTLQELFEPGVPVATLLEKVIRYYGLNPVDCAKYPNGEGLRKNCRLLFAALLDDETVDELLVYFMKVANGRLS